MDEKSVGGGKRRGGVGEVRVVSARCAPYNDANLPNIECPEDGALPTHFRVTYVPERAPPLCPAQTREVGGEQDISPLFHRCRWPIAASTDTRSVESIFHNRVPR